MSRASYAHARTTAELPVATRCPFKSATIPTIVPRAGNWPSGFCQGKNGSPNDDRNLLLLPAEVYPPSTSNPCEWSDLLCHTNFGRANA